jgi:phage minor structural protein
MIVYFADRKMNILGMGSTELRKGLTIANDKKTEEIETGVAIFECDIPYDSSTREKVNACAEVGNYILRKNDDENEFYTIIESEIDTKKQVVYIYAEDDGMDLLNDVVGAYEADKAYPISHYINKFSAGSGFVIGRNEVSSLTRKLSWDGESTAAARLASVATQFDGCEISYSFDIKGLFVTKKYINIYKQRGKDIGIQLRLNQDIDSITTSKSIANLATALECTGGTPENSENPITLKNYTYDDGDFYVDGTVLKSRTALKKWARYLWRTEQAQASGGHIVKQFSYDTTSPATLCSHARTELKKAREIEVNYAVDLKKLPENVKIGDRVNIIDDEGGLYLSTRILKLEVSVAEKEQTATLGEYLIKGSGIAQKVADLAAQFAKNSVSATRALAIANNAKAAANAAQTQADQAVSDAASAQTAANAAQQTADQAEQSAQEAQTAANNAQTAVGEVVESVTSLQETVTNAQTAADNAYTAAQTAQTKAEEAATAASNAVKDATEAKTAAATAQSTADGAVTNAETAISTANTAKAQAEGASATAEAAKADAQEAQKEIDSLGDNLDTLSHTMTAEYARKTDLTEATSNLQTQITQNAGTIATHAKQITTIDETANNAAEQAEAANNTAAAAQKAADKATADATAAQTAADTAKTAAANAQSEADAAKTAAETAKNVADKAETDLEAAKADLATVQGRVDATEEDIAAAEAAVADAQAAADKAKADATAAVEAAETAQTKANTAVDNAAAAQKAANDAASKANLAQKTADEAKGDATAAQTKAQEAAEAAAKAQSTADTAKTNADTAQATADTAAQKALAAQNAANDADAKAQQAAADLATAQQNLANVTSRVDATAEEVAAAQAAVETAQKAADLAKTNAQAAQATADTAKANAQAAQNAADTAKTAADNAQAAADEARSAAEQAQLDVDNLESRVTSTETLIEQNTKDISLSATKEEVTETLGGFYTKEEVEALLKIKANEIIMKFTEENKSIYDENGKLQEQINGITKYFTFNLNGLTIGEVDSPNKIVIDNKKVAIIVNGVEVEQFDATGKGLIPDLEVTRSFELLGLLITEDNERVNCRDMEV